MSFLPTFPDGLTEIRGGLEFLTPPARQAVDAAYSAASLQVPPGGPWSIKMQMLPPGGQQGLQVIQQLVSAGYVVLVSTPPFAEVFATKNPLVVEEKAGPAGGGSWAIYDGPGALISIAQAGVKVPGPTWAFPVAVGVGVVSLIWLLRR